MAAVDDWSVDFIAKVISHVDGVLDYDTGAGTQPAVGDVIRGGTSGAVGKIIARTGTAASGTFTLTSVDGKFQDNETLTRCDKVDFDGVVNNGFKVGDTITGATSTRSGVARFIEYNLTSTAGFGTVWSEQFGAGSWTDNENIQVGGQTRALANGTGSDLSGTWTLALVNELTNGTISPPTGSKSLIINFDGGTKLIPRFAKIQNTNTTSPTREGFVQRVYGVTATGSLRLVDTTGTWTDNDPIYVIKIPYDNLQSGQKFKVGDKIVTKASAGGADVRTGKIIDVETLTATTGKITLQNQSGLVTDNHRIEVRTTSDTYVADVNALTAGEQYEQHATQNGSEIKTQLATQGGLYATADGLNVVRDCNELYTLLQDTFDELSALDDDIPMTAQVALQQYTMVNSWKIPDPSFRFLESGSIQDSGLDNIFTNYQTLGSVEGIGDTVYAATTPLPQFYIEQDGSLLTPWWKEGHVDVLVKVKTNSDMTRTANADGALINSGTITLFNRNYSDTYDHFTTTTIAGVAPVPLATSNDLDNATGTHTMNFDGGTASQPLTVGEEIVSTTPNDPTKRGIVTKYTSSTGPDVTGAIDYELTGATQFADNDVITGQKSTFAKTVNLAPTTLVAGYGSRVIIATVEITIAHGAVTGTFIPGERVDQAVSGAAGIFMATVSGTMTIGNTTGTFNGTNVITGATSTATTTPSAGPSNATTIQRDVAQAKTTGDGSGNQPYNAVIYLNRDNQAEGDTLARMYEWLKYKTRRLETAGEPVYNLIGGKGTEAGKAGRFYISQDTAYAPVKASPLGTFAGGKFFGARGVFVQQMHSNDIRSFQLVDANSTVRNPPNKQTLKVDGVVSGDRVAVFRRASSTPGSGIMVNEYTVAAFIAGDAWNGSGDTKIRVAAGTRTVSPLADDIPDSGVIRVRNATTQLYESFTYTAVDRTNNDFTVSALASDLTAGENVFVPLIESQATGTSVTQDIIHTGTDIPLLSRVRKRGILPFQAEGTFGSAGATVSAIRTADTIVD